jgi:hypothetical protein
MDTNSISESSKVMEARQGENGFTDSQTAIVDRKHPLENLIPELLLEIGSFIPIESRLCLHLASKPIAKKLVNEFLDQAAKAFGPLNPKATSLENLTKPSTADGKPWYWSPRHDFLQLLGRDFAELIYCHFCQKIHHPDLSDNISGPHSSGPFIAECSHQNRYASTYYGHSFTFSRACIAMKSHQMGHPHTRYHLLRLVESFESAERHRYPHFQSQSTVKIVNNRLYTRRTYQRPVVGIGEEVTLATRFEIPVCCHVRVKTREDIEFPNWAAQFVFCVRYKYDRGNRSARETIRGRNFHCSSCPTDIEVVLNKRGPRFGGDDLEITVWQDLGECITPFDHAWYSHFQNTIPPGPQSGEGYKGCMARRERQIYQYYNYKGPHAIFEELPVKPKSFVQNPAQSAQSLRPVLPSQTCQSSPMVPPLDWLSQLSQLSQISQNRQLNRYNQTIPAYRTNPPTTPSASFELHRPLVQASSGYRNNWHKR